MPTGRLMMNARSALCSAVGCGKSGCITLAPVAFRANRALVVAPGISITGQLVADFDPANAGMFYQKCRIFTGGPYPEPAEMTPVTPAIGFMLRAASTSFRANTKRRSNFLSTRF